MSGKDDTTELPVEIGDPLAGKIRDSILGVENLRGENRRLADEIKDREVTNLQLESEIQCLDRAEHCERAASILRSPNAVSTFLQAARSWREMAEQYREQERARGTFPAAPRIGSS